MEKLKEIAKQLNVLPKLQLGIKLKTGGVKSTGTHIVKFLSEPIIVMGKDDKGTPRKELKFTVEENGTKYRWNIPLLNKEGQPNYLLERLLNVEVNDVRELEMTRQGAKNYVDVRTIDEQPEPPDEEEIIEHE